MKKYLPLSIITILLFFTSCKEQPVPYSNNVCKSNSPFVAKLGFDPNRSYFSTSDARRMGLVLVQAADIRNPTAGAARVYQDSTWKMGGWLAPIQIDDLGNIYVAPVPFINVMHNDATKQNTIFQVNAQSGKMQQFLSLPTRANNNNENPFGIIGFAYLCETNTLYVSSVAGSTRKEELGVIYAVDVRSQKIIDSLPGVDALGLGIAYVADKRQLFLGHARSAQVFSIDLNREGKFLGKPTIAFSLDGLGVRGDDKVRRIKTDTDGSLIVYGMEFNFNLIAPHEKQETVYHFVFDATELKWIRKL
ncbi:MAG: hypothetical protein RLY16_1277 [Bacteroidota bacterium]